MPAAHSPSRIARGTPSTHVRDLNTSSPYSPAKVVSRIAVFAYICQQSRGRWPVVAKYAATRSRSVRWKAGSPPKVSARVGDSDRVGLGRAQTGAASTSRILGGDGARARRGSRRRLEAGCVARATKATGPRPTARSGCLRHVHHQLPALERLVVELADRRLRFGVRGHLDESESAGVTGHAIGDHRGRLDRAALAEVLAQALGGGGIGQTADIQIGRHTARPCGPVRGRGAHELIRISNTLR